MARARTSSKEVRQLLKRVEKAGGVIHDGGRHWKVVGPDGITFLSKTPGGASNGRERMNAIRDLRRAGLDV